MIFLAGELHSAQRVSELIQKYTFDFYAADGGIQIAQKLSLPLSRILGDFDSAEKPALPGVLLYPSEKDQTDSELALELALADGYRDIWMIAPFGGRLDHSVANLCLLEKAFFHHAALRLYDGKNLAFLLEKGVHQLASHFHYISFFPWGKNAVVTLRDFKYPLDHYTLQLETPIGISNEPLGNAPSIEIHSGRILCICIEK